MIKKFGITMLTLIFGVLTLWAISSKESKGTQNSVLQVETEAQIEMSPQCKKYAEGACSINGKSGTQCVGGVGDCKKQYTCKPLPDLHMAIPDNPTMSEIDAGATAAANWLVANDDFCATEWQFAYDISHLSYVQFYGL